MLSRDSCGLAHGNDDLHFAVLIFNQTVEALLHDVVGGDPTRNERGEINLATLHEFDRVGVIVRVANRTAHFAVLHGQLARDVKVDGMSVNSNDFKPTPWP